MYIHMCMYMYMCIYNIYIYIKIHEHIPALCVCVADAAGAFFLVRGCPWIFGACILWMFVIFVDFRVPDGSAIVR